MVQVSQITTVEDLINDPNFNINDYEGYIYMTSFLDLNKSYIGKKTFKFKNNIRLTKKEIDNLPITRGKNPTKKLVTKESDWKVYYGSSNEVKSIIKSNPDFSRITRSVLQLCKTKKQMTYYECKYLFQYNVLEDDRYFNDNIQGRLFRKDLI